MTTEKVNDLEQADFFDFFSPDTFRIVPAEVAEQHGGISEVPVAINAHFNASLNLNFNASRMQQFFGFARINQKVLELNGAPYFGTDRKGKIERITLNDSGALWIMVFDFFDKTSLLYSVKAEDVISLLNNCRKPCEKF